VASAHSTLQYSLYLLYWYKSANTDAEGAAIDERIRASELASTNSKLQGTQLTCCTAASVQILTPQELVLQGQNRTLLLQLKSTNTDTFTSTKVQILTPEELVLKEQNRTL
jgi:hypothetical protein